MPLDVLEEFTVLYTELKERIYSLRPRVPRVRRKGVKRREGMPSEVYVKMEIDRVLRRLSDYLRDQFDQ